MMLFVWGFIIGALFMYGVERLTDWIMEGGTQEKTAGSQAQDDGSTEKSNIGDKP